jgi:tetratricopeptide (TPR) repeat protein
MNSSGLVQNATVRMRPGVGSWLPRFSYWVLLLGLVGVNSWLAWEGRPLPDLATVSRLMGKELYDEAETVLRAQVRRSPHNGEARMMLARALTARNDLAGAAEQLHGVSFWWPTKSEALFREGQLLMALGRARQAEQAWKACVANDPLHPAPARIFTHATRELIELYRWEQRIDDARDLIWKVYSQVDGSGRASLLILSVWLELLRDEPAQAAEKLSRFVAADAHDWEARLALARALTALGKAVEAEQQIQICLKSRPDDLRAWRSRLAILSLRGGRTEIESALEQHPESAHDDAETWMSRGLASERIGNVRGAAEAYRQTIKRRPGSDEACYRLSIAEDRLGERAQAEEHRRQHQALVEAREQLRRAYDAYLDATRSPHTSRAVLPSTFERLSESCAAVGLQREAQAWPGLRAKP